MSLSLARGVAKAMSDYYELDQVSWPWCSKSLIKENNASNESAEIGPRVFTWGLYSEAYQTAVELLLDYYMQVKEEDPLDDCNGLILPILHLVRHTIELKIKQLSMHVANLFRIHDNLREIHELDDLWDGFVVMVEQNWEEPTERLKERMGSVRSVLKDIMALDPKAQFFRYPVDKSGNRNPVGKRSIDLLHLYISFENVLEQLKSIAYLIELKAYSDRAKWDMSQIYMQRVYSDIEEDKMEDIYRAIDLIDCLQVIPKSAELGYRALPKKSKRRRNRKKRNEL